MERATQHTLAIMLCITEGGRTSGRADDGAVEIYGVHSSMVLCRMMFGEVISFVANAWFPIDAKLVLRFPIIQPVKTHVHTFGFLLFDFAVDDAGRCFVVGLKRCAR